MWQSKFSQAGATLLTVLVMLLLILMLGLAAARIALQGEKAARNDRDRHIAFQAAEAGLLNAEIDIAHSFDAAISRSHIFTQHSESGFPLLHEEGCNRGLGNAHLGLCRPAPDGSAAAREGINFFDDTADGAHTVPYGRFTGNQFLAGIAALPAREPRYVVELMVDHKVSQLTGKPSYFYRITAIGYGASVGTQVVLQSVYRKRQAEALTKEQPSVATGRLSWREIINWHELHAAGN